MAHREGEVTGAGAGDEDINDGENDRDERVLRRSTGRDAVYETPEVAEGVESPDGGASADDSREMTSTTEYGTPQGVMSNDNAIVMDRILQALNFEMHQQLENYRRQLDEAGAKARHLEFMVKGQENQIAALKAELSETKAEKSEVEKERELLTEACASARFEVEARETQLLEAQNSVEALCKEMETLRESARQGDQIAKEVDPKALQAAIQGGDPGFTQTTEVRESLLGGSMTDRRETMSRIRLSTGVSQKEDPAHFATTVAFVNRVAGTPGGTASQQIFMSSAEFLLQQSAQVREITGLTSGTMIPDKECSDQDLEKIIQQIRKHLQGQLKSKSDLKAAGGMPHFIYLMREAFRAAGRHHLVGPFQYRTPQEVHEEYMNVFTEEKERRQKLNKPDPVERLGRIFLQDQKCIYAAVEALAAPLSTVIQAEVNGEATADSEASPARNLDQAGFWLLILAQRELEQIDSFDMVTRLHDILDMINQYKPRFNGNYQYYAEEVTKEISAYSKDYGAITPLKLQHAMLIPILLKASGNSEVAWRKKLQTLGKWDHNTSNYSVMSGQINTLSESLMQYQRENFKKLWDQLPVAKHVYRRTNKPTFELALFASQDTAPVCGQCGHRHGKAEACLTDANMKRVLDELEPKIKLFKEKTDQLKSLVSKPQQPKVQADISQIVERMQEFIKALEQAAHQRKRDHRKTARVQAAEEKPEKPTMDTAAATSDDALRQRVQEMVKAAMMSKQQAGAAAQGARLSDAGVNDPKKACFNWVEKGKTCTRTNCPYTHNPADKDTVDRARGGGGSDSKTPRGSDTKANPTIKRLPGTTCAAKNCTNECIQEGDRIHRYCSRGCASKDGAFKGNVSSSPEKANTAAVIEESAASAFAAHLYESSPDLLQSIPSTFVAVSRENPDDDVAVLWLTDLPDNLNHLDLMREDVDLEASCHYVTTSNVGGEIHEMEMETEGLVADESVADGSDQDEANVQLSYRDCLVRDTSHCSVSLNASHYFLTKWFRKWQEADRIIRAIRQSLQETDTLAMVCTGITAQADPGQIGGEVGVTDETEMDKVAAEIVRGFRLRNLFRCVYAYVKRGTLYHLKRTMLRWRSTCSEIGSVRRAERARQQAELDAANECMRRSDQSRADKERHQERQREDLRQGATDAAQDIMNSILRSCFHHAEQRESQRQQQKRDKVVTWSGVSDVKWAIDELGLGSPSVAQMAKGMEDTISIRIESDGARGDHQTAHIIVQVEKVVQEVSDELHKHWRTELNWKLRGWPCSERRAALAAWRDRYDQALSLVQDKWQEYCLELPLQHSLPHVDDASHMLPESRMYKEYPDVVQKMAGVHRSNLTDEARKQLGLCGRKLGRDIQRQTAIRWLRSQTYRNGKCHGPSGARESIRLTKGMLARRRRAMWKMLRVQKSSADEDMKAQASWANLAYALTDMQLDASLLDDDSIFDIIAEESWEALGLGSLSRSGWIDRVGNLDLEAEFRDRDLVAVFDRQYNVSADGSVYSGNEKLDNNIDESVYFRGDILRDFLGTDDDTSSNTGSSRSDDGGDRTEDPITDGMPGLRASYLSGDFDEDDENALPSLVRSSSDEDEEDSLPCDCDDTLHTEYRINSGYRLVPTRHVHSGSCVPAIEHIDDSDDYDADDSDSDDPDVDAGTHVPDTHQPGALTGNHISQRQWEPLSSAGKIRGMNLAEVVAAEASRRAYPAMEVSEGPNVFLQEVLSSFKPYRTEGKVMWLIDTGATAFLSPYDTHVCCAEKIHMPITGLGDTVATRRSPLILTTVDADGCYSTIQYPKCYNLLDGPLDFCLASTGALERNGFKFSINFDHPHYITAGGRVVPLVTDRVSGFHWLVEHIDAGPSMVLRQECLRQAQQLLRDRPHSVHFAGTPTIYHASAPEVKPDGPCDEEMLDEQLRHHSGGSVGWNKDHVEIKLDQRVREWVDGVAAGQTTPKEREQAAAAYTGQSVRVEAGDSSREWTRLFNQALRLYKADRTESVGHETKAYIRFLYDQEAMRHDAACPASAADDAETTHARFLVGKRLVWVKIRGYPWWPAIKVRLEDVPSPYRENIPSAKSTGVRLVYTFGDRQFSWVKSEADTMKDWRESYDEFTKTKRSKLFQTAVLECEEEEAVPGTHYPPKDESQAASQSTPAEPASEEGEGQQTADDEYISKVKKEQERIVFKRPIRLKMPAMRLADNGEESDVQKLKTYVHRLFGHYEMSKIFRAIDHIRGAEIIRILKTLRGVGPSMHCDSCAENKSRLPPMPKGRTERPLQVREVKKIYVDLTGYIMEPSVYHNFHYAMAATTDKGFSEIIGLTHRAQSLLGMARIFAALGGVPEEIQIDGEGTLNTEPAKAWMSGRGTGRYSKVTLTEAYHHFRNGRIERRWDTWKSHARCMLGQAGLSIRWWWYALKFAVNVSNILDITTDDAGTEVTVWEAHFGEKPDLQRILLGPFGSLAYLILSEEQRRAKGISGSFGVRAIAGIYLGPAVCPKSGVFHHLVTDGGTIYASPNNVKIVPDVFPAKLNPEREQPVVQVPDEYAVLAQEATDTLTPSQAWFGRCHDQACKEAATEEQDERAYLKSYSEQLYSARQGKARGDARRFGTRRKPYQIVAGPGGSTDAEHDRAFQEGIDPSKEINYQLPEDYEVDPVPMEHNFVEPYKDARYCLAVPVNFEDPLQVPQESPHPHNRFVNRRVRKAFLTPDKKGKQVARNFEGKVISYSVKRQLFRVVYDDGDPEEYDFQDLADILIMDVRYGDDKSDAGKTRAEKLQAVKMGTFLAAVQEQFWESITSRVHLAYDRCSHFQEQEQAATATTGASASMRDSMSEYRYDSEPTTLWPPAPHRQVEVLTAGAQQVHHAATGNTGPGNLDIPVPDGKKPIYDDEPNNPQELACHPERDAILESSAKEIQQYVDMKVGVLLSPKEVDDVIKTGGKILRSRMIYKRKYCISPTTKKEEFLKWKGRLAVNGAGQTEGVDTVWNTFSPTIGFSAIRSMIAIVCNPKYITESFDLSGAFLGTKLEDQAVYVRLPPDAGEYGGRVLRLLRAVYGLKSSGASFMKQLGDEILKFEERVTTVVPDEVSGRKGESGKTRTRVEYCKFQRTLTDQCVYVYRDSLGREMLFLSYVDDIICATTDVELRDRFFDHLRKTWSITSEGTLDRFLACQFQRSEDKWAWRATMSAYIEKIAHRFDLTETRNVKTPMEPGFCLMEDDFKDEPTEAMKTEMRSIIGSIGYAVTALRYDVAYAVSVLSRHLVRPCHKVLDAARRVVMYLYQTRDFYIEWRSSEEEIQEGTANVLTGSVDSSFGMDNMTRRSHAGYMNFVNHGAVSWKSGLQPIVTLSSCEAEYLGLCAEVCEVKYLRNLLADLGYEQKESTLIWEDNRAAILVAQQECSSAGRCKHIDIRYRFVAEAIKDRIVRVRYTPTDLNLADLLTKPLACKEFERLVEMCRDRKTTKFAIGDKELSVNVGQQAFLVYGC